MTRRNDNSPGRAALRGAVAGALGGAVMLAAERLADYRVFSRHGSAGDAMGAVAALAARKRGKRLSRRQRNIASVAMHLAYSAAVGALYGVARSSELSRPAVGLLDSGLVYAASLAARDVTSGRGRKRLRAGKRSRMGVIPMSAHSLFGMATAEAFDLLSQR